MHNPRQNGEAILIKTKTEKMISFLLYYIVMPNINNFGK